MNIISDFRYLCRGFFGEDRTLYTKLPCLGDVVIKYRDQYQGSFIRIYKNGNYLSDKTVSAKDKSAADKLVQIAYLERSIDNLNDEVNKQYNEMVSARELIDVLRGRLNKLKSEGID